LSKIELAPISEVEFDGPITICPPGRKSRDIAERDRPSSTIPLYTQTALAWPQTPSIVPPARGDRRSAQERVDAAQRADAMRVALSQPHRDGNADAMLECALGAYCYRAWPRNISEHGDDVNKPWRFDMFRAGQTYGIIVHQHRVWLGLGAGGRTSPEGAQVTLSDEQIKAHCDDAKAKRAEADGVLWRIGSGAVSAMMRIAVDEFPPLAHHEDILRACLYHLAIQFGIVKKGRFQP